MSQQAISDIITQAQPVPETQAQTIARLATLSALDYDRVRKAEAKTMGVQVTTLDKEVIGLRSHQNETEGMAGLFPAVTPWTEAVNPAQLLDDIQSLVRFYIVCSTETAIATTLWIAFTWFVDKVDVAPIAMITAPEKRCGKSQLLTLIGKLASRPLQASNLSPAAIFRVIEAYGPTLLIDEADTFMRENEEILCVINSGHTRQSAQVIRLVGDNHEPQKFSTWGAKAISGIGALPDTIMDRSVILELRRKLPHEKVARLRHAEPLQFEIFKSQLCRFAQDAGHAIQTARPALPEELNDRAQDNWEPLLAIADFAGGHWPVRARDAALKISGADHDAPSLSSELLGDIKEVFEGIKLAEKISTADLLEKLNADDLKPWATYNRGKPMSPRQLARRLGEYGIKPQTIRIGSGTMKGFYRTEFDDVFARYLSLSADRGILSVTPEQVNQINGIGENLSVTHPLNVTDEKHEKPLKNMSCYAVTDKTGVQAGNIVEVTI